MSDLNNFLNKLNFNNQAILDAFKRDCLKGEPSSLIRLGDGEAKILGQAQKNNPNTVERQLKIWFGDRDFSNSEINEIRSDLLDSVIKAKYICAPTPERTFRLNPDDSFTNDANHCQELWRVLKEVRSFPAEKYVGSAVIHKHAQISKWFSEIFKLDRKFIFVTRSTKAIFRIAEAFSLRSFEAHILPGESWSRKERTSSHFPVRYRQVRDALGSPSTEGAIALIGGGILAKTYCRDVENAGGMAFDCGALFDGWADEVPEQRRANMGDLKKMSVGYLSSST
ncbi:GT-D fold domain-containing protein [Tritonibacter mobilis]|uniref:GT-D fold domain-containing protein n=1 Tax=Tritonibacter mobilis TaxID=379347 RepID=UPI001CD9B797|nr:hypothetical protein [Tritonibacter mobilis]MCA2008851.1 hypothetical protein [Tritonibacter mobilis]